MQEQPPSFGGDIEGVGHLAQQKLPSKGEQSWERAPSCQAELPVFYTSWPRATVFIVNAGECV